MSDECPAPDTIAAGWADLRDRGLHPACGRIARKSARVGFFYGANYMLCRLNDLIIAASRREITGKILVDEMRRFNDEFTSFLEAIDAEASREAESN